MMKAIPLSRVLWRTRGRSWDYAFLLTPPEDQPAGGWYKTFQNVFHHNARTRGSSRTDLVVVRAARADGTTMLVAAGSVTEPGLKDQAGRPIRHYFMWCLEGEEDERDGIELSKTWPTQLAQGLTNAFEAVFETNPRSEAINLASVIRHSLVPSDTPLPSIPLKLSDVENFKPIDLSFSLPVASLPSRDSASPRRFGDRGKRLRWKGILAFAGLVAFVALWRLTVSEDQGEVAGGSEPAEEQEPPRPR